MKITRSRYTLPLPLATLISSLILFVSVSVPVSRAQTQVQVPVPVPVSNPSFSASLSLSTPCGPNCAYNSGPIPGWTLVGQGGSFEPGPALFPSLSPNTVIAYLNGGTLSQSLPVSVQPNSIYTLATQIGQRSDNLQGSYTISLSAGSVTLQTVSGSNSTIPPGTFSPRTLNYSAGANPPPGSLAITVASSGQQIEIGGVQLSYTLTSTSASPPTTTSPASNVVITWTPSTSASTTGYLIFRATGPSAPVLLSFVPSTSAATYTDTTTTAGTTYTYTIEAVIAQSVLSNPSTVTVPSP